METNRTYCEDCVETMKRMPDEFLDLTVTSPPYDNLRDYNGYVFDFEAIARGLWKVTKPGGVVVWVVADATINGSETLTSFKQAIFFRELGFNVHDTMIFLKTSVTFPCRTRYHSGFEYMFVFSKGPPKTVHLIKDRHNKTAGMLVHGLDRKKDGRLVPKSRLGEKIPEKGARMNWWLMHNCRRGLHTKHPATFSEELASGHIFTWSNRGDLVYDPFMGSGTTAKAAVLLGRNFIGSEISQEYCQIAEARIREVFPEYGRKPLVWRHHAQDRRQGDSLPAGRVRLWLYSGFRDRVPAPAKCR